jgi:hypothetical protein
MTCPVFISYARGSNQIETIAPHYALGGQDGLGFVDTTDIQPGATFPRELKERGIPSNWRANRDNASQRCKHLHTRCLASWHSSSCLRPRDGAKPAAVCRMSHVLTPFPCLTGRLQPTPESGAAEGRPVCRR